MSVHRIGKCRFKRYIMLGAAEIFINALRATMRTDAKGVAEYANVYVFWNEGKIVGVGSISSFLGKPDRKHTAYYFCIAGASWTRNWQLYH